MCATTRPVWPLMVLSVAFLLYGCGESKKPPPPPAPEVTVSQPVKQKVTDYLEATGTAAALESVEIRARVEGWLDSIKFVPRAKVKDGELLFVIDPRQYQAKVNQAKAVLEAKKADLRLAQIEYEKAKYLVEKAAISELKFDEATAKRDIAKADVGIAQANLETAQLNLDYTQVKSPINGRVSRNLVDQGNLVGAGNKTKLASVVDDESIYAYFNLSEREFLPLMRSYQEHRRAEKSEGKEEADPLPAYLALSDETGYPHQGHIDYASTEVDPSTGTIQIRAIFPNPTGLILQGMFVRIRLPVAEYESLLVPDVAIQADQAGRYLLVVDDKGVVEQRQVTTGSLVKGMRVIKKGLKKKDWVIVNGLQRARPGGKVKATKASKKPAPKDKTKAQKSSGAETQKPKEAGSEKQAPKSPEADKGSTKTKHPAK